MPLAMASEGLLNALFKRIISFPMWTNYVKIFQCKTVNKETLNDLF